MERQIAIGTAAQLPRGRHALEIGPGTLRVGVTTAHRAGVEVDADVTAAANPARRVLDDIALSVPRGSPSAPRVPHRPNS